MNRRDFLLTASAVSLLPKSLKAEPQPAKTKFQVACMTLPYARFSFERALKGIKGAGFEFVALGTTHMAGGKSLPILAADAAPERAKEVGGQCRDAGLEPLMMFSMIYPENDKALDVLTNRLKQAAAAKIPQVLTFGHTKGGNKKLWIDRFKLLAPIAKDLNVMLVVKQHGGETGTGEACAAITREVDQPNIKVNFDAGNVMDYLNVDPIADLKKCAADVRSFCIKDHRHFPKDQDCGPGLGEIDHYRLLAQVAFTGLAMPLCCENIFAPALPRPEQAEGVDALAKRAREFLELVIAGVQASPSKN
jgi:sugar phosphate isomerase/epimerase